MKRALLLLLFVCAAVTLWLVAPHGLERDLRRAVHGVDAEVGVAVVREGRVIASVNGNRPMPAMSTFKFPLALAVAARLDSLGLPLSAQLEVTADDLWPDTWSPLREAHPAGGRFSFGELLHYTVAESDNCACDRLIRELGGIGALQRYMDGLPAEGFDFRATERMFRRFEAQRLNRATPEAMALLMDRFRHEELIAREYGDFLWRTLCETTTGADKLRAGLPEGTTIGHKTGSSDRNARGVKIADNDLGYVELSDGSGYAICVYVSETTLSDRESAALIAAVSRLVWQRLSAE